MPKIIFFQYLLNACNQVEKSIETFPIIDEEKKQELRDILSKLDNLLEVIGVA